MALDDKVFRSAIAKINKIKARQSLMTQVQVFEDPPHLKKENVNNQDSVSKLVTLSENQQRADETPKLNAIQTSISIEPNDDHKWGTKKGTKWGTEKGTKNLNIENR